MILVGCCRRGRRKDGNASWCFVSPFIMTDSETSHRSCPAKSGDE
jgi:hypothetical protein